MGSSAIEGFSMNKIQIKAEKRILGKSALRVARKGGYLPAIIYGRKFNPVPVQVKIKDFEGAYAQAGESALVYVDLGEQSLPVIIHDVARDYLADSFRHADFYKVNLDEKVTADVPVVLIGEAPAVKSLGGILVKNINSIKVEALPQNLPSQIEVDVSILQNFREEILIKNLAIPVGVEVKDKLDAIVVLIQEPISQEELDKQLAVTEAGVEDVEVIKKEKEEAAPESEAEAEPAAK